MRVEPGESSAGRSTRTGPGRLLIAVYAVFAVAATGRSLVQLTLYADRALVPYLLSALAALVYVVATVALARSTRIARAVAWTACLVELAGVLSVGWASRAQPGWFPDDTVWSNFGQGYAFLPLVLPFAGLSWLVATRR